MSRQFLPGAIARCPDVAQYWKDDFVIDLPDAAIDAHLAHAGDSPSELPLMHPQILTA